MKLEFPLIFAIDIMAFEHRAKSCLEFYFELFENVNFTKSLCSSPDFNYHSDH